MVDDPAEVDCAHHPYGDDPEQFGELTLPGDRAVPAAVVVLLHGGFWRAHRSLDLMRPLVGPLAGEGLATWNLEYRRVGQPGGGFPGTLTDVSAGIDALRGLPERPALDLDRVVVVGHSAGGQLALWAASHRPVGPTAPTTGGTGRVQPAAVISLAGVCDLTAAAAAELGAQATRQFLGGTPDDVADRYRAASPADLLPLGVRQLLVHGDADDKVPISQSRDHVRRARAAGDDADVVELRGAGHMAVIEPDVVLDAVRRVMPARAS